MKLVKKSILWCSLMGFLVIFSVAQVQAQSGGEQSGISGHEQLAKGKSVFQETWVHPDADFSQYSRIYIWDPVFEYRDVGPARRARSTMNSTHKREFGISDKDREKVEEIVTAAFLKEMQKGKRFELVDTVGPDTLLLRAAVLDIISNVPPETAGRGDVYISSVGQGTFVMELIDSETGVVQALVAERRAMSRPGGGISSSPASAPTIIADIRRWSSSAAQRLRKELDKAMAGG